MDIKNIDLTETPFKAPSFFYRLIKSSAKFIWQKTEFIRIWIEPHLVTARPYLRNKYAYSFYFFLAYITFIDQYTIIQRISLSFKNDQLIEKIEEKKKEVENNRKQIYELKTDEVTLEQFAREHFYMHRQGEEVFILKE